MQNYRHIVTRMGVKPYWYWAKGCDGTVTEQNGESLVSLVCTGVEGCDGNVTERFLKEKRSENVSKTDKYFSFVVYM